MISNPILLNIVIIICLLWLTTLTFMLWQNTRHYNRLTKGIKKKELHEILDQLLTQLKDNKQETEKLREWLAKLEKQESLDLKKVGFIRFNPFADTGGNQSFCVAILDGHDSGIVISSLHSRDQTRVYAKAITAGKAEGQALSKDEKEAIRIAHESPD